MNALNHTSRLPESPSIPSEDQLSPIQSQPAFPLYPGETPRAYAAFTTFFQLGQGRSHQAVAAQLDEKCHTVRNWASRYHWTDRLNAFNASLLEQQAQAEVEARRQMAAEWVRRSNECREAQWLAAQKLLHAIQCVLDSFGDREAAKITLSEVARTFQIVSRITRETWRGATGPDSQVPARRSPCGGE